MEEGRRLDEVLARELGIGRRAAVRLVAEVRVNGRRATKGIRLRAGDHVVLPACDGAPAAASAPLDVVRELDDVLVVAKPAGLPTVALRGARGDSLAARIALARPECAQIGGPGECGLVHRLDTGTSGLLLVARNAPAYAALRAAFRDHRVAKEYLALVGGDLSRATRITSPIGRHRSSRRRMHAAEPGRAARRWVVQPAATEVEPVRRVGRFTLVRARSTTGVRHQIRVHLASIGHALVNDTLYGGEAAPDLPGFLLHASALRWPDPRSGELHEDRLDLPEPWRRVLDELAS